MFPPPSPILHPRSARPRPSSIPHPRSSPSSQSPPRHRCRPGLTLVEMLTTVAALVIVLGLMVSLARHVRSRSAGHTTRDLLARLERGMSQYQDLQKRLHAAPRLIPIPMKIYDEAVVQKAALANNRAFVEAARDASKGQLFRGLSFSMFDDLTLRDAWGTPVAYMPPGATNIGIAPQNRYFFLSAGPDRQFTSLLDNLYSYERPLDP